MQPSEGKPLAQRRLFRSTHAQRLAFTGGHAGLAGWRNPTLRTAAAGGLPGETGDRRLRAALELGRIAIMKDPAIAADPVDRCPDLEAAVVRPVAARSRAAARGCHPDAALAATGACRVSDRCAGDALPSPPGGPGRMEGPAIVGAALRNPCVRAADGHLEDGAAAAGMAAPRGKRRAGCRPPAPKPALSGPPRSETTNDEQAGGQRR
jgi:hypothetical protein